MTDRSLASAGALVVGDGRILLIRQQRRGEGTWWEIPGGHLDGGESLQECAAREVAEETGIQAVIGDIAFTLLWRWPAEKRSNIIVVFEGVATSSDSATTPQRDENIDLAEFWPIDDLPFDLVHPAYREPLRAWLAAGSTSGPPRHHHCEFVTDQGETAYKIS